MEIKLEKVKRLSVLCHLKTCCLLLDQLLLYLKIKHTKGFRALKQMWNQVRTWVRKLLEIFELINRWQFCHKPIRKMNRNLPISPLVKTKSCSNYIQSMKGRAWRYTMVVVMEALEFMMEKPLCREDRAGELSPI